MSTMPSPPEASLQHAQAEVCSTPLATEPSFVAGIDALCILGGQPMNGAVEKVLPRLAAHARGFIALSPFLCIASGDGAGHMDVSPRGDPPGFVHVVDDHTLLLPDRPGNRRFDTMKNLMSQGSVGLIFFVPGFGDTLRVNGTGRVTNDAALLQRCIVEGHTPTLGLLVTVREVFFHCPKALIRSRLWDPQARVDRASFPSMGKIIKDQLQLQESASDIDESVQRANAAQLYRAPNDSA